MYENYQARQTTAESIIPTAYCPHSDASANIIWINLLQKIDQNWHDMYVNHFVSISGITFKPIWLYDPFEVLFRDDEDDDEQQFSTSELLKSCFFKYSFSSPFLFFQTLFKIF